MDRKGAFGHQMVDEFGQDDYEMSPEESAEGAQSQQDFLQFLYEQANPMISPENYLVPGGAALGIKGAGMALRHAPKLMQGAGRFLGASGGGAVTGEHVLPGLIGADAPVQAGPQEDLTALLAEHEKSRPQPPPGLGATLQPIVPPKGGNRKAAVVVQEKLAKAGYYNGEIDGDFGSNSRAALEAYNAAANDPTARDQAAAARKAYDDQMAQWSRKGELIMGQLSDIRRQEQTEKGREQENSALNLGLKYGPYAGLGIGAGARKFISNKFSKQAKDAVKEVDDLAGSDAFDPSRLTHRKTIDADMGNVNSAWTKGGQRSPFPMGEAANKQAPVDKLFSKGNTGKEIGAGLGVSAVAGGEAYVASSMAADFHNKADEAEARGDIASAESFRQQARLATAAAQTGLSTLGGYAASSKFMPIARPKPSATSLGRLDGKRLDINRALKSGDMNNPAPKTRAAAKPRAAGVSAGTPKASAKEASKNPARDKGKEVREAYRAKVLKAQAAGNASPPIPAELKKGGVGTRIQNEVKKELGGPAQKELKLKEAAGGAGAGIGLSQLLRQRAEEENGS